MDTYSGSRRVLALWRCPGNRERMAMIPSSHSRDMWIFQLHKQEAIVSNIHILIRTLKNSYSQFHTCPCHAVSHLSAFVHLPGKPGILSSLTNSTFPLRLSLGITSRKVLLLLWVRCLPSSCADSIIYSPQHIYCLLLHVSLTWLWIPCG